MGAAVFRATLPPLGGEHAEHGTLFKINNLQNRVPVTFTQHTKHPEHSMFSMCFLQITKAEHETRPSICVVEIVLVSRRLAEAALLEFFDIA